MEQKLLFELRSPRWTERLWRRVPPDLRSKAVTLVAELARRSLSCRRATQAKETRHES